MVAVSLVLYIVDDLSSTQPPIQSLSCLHPKCFFSSTYNRLSGLIFLSLFWVVCRMNAPPYIIIRGSFHIHEGSFGDSLRLLQ